MDMTAKVARQLMMAVGVLFLAVPAMAAPRVAASIKPIHALVAGVMAGVADPDLLITGNASPHAFTLKPSDAERLNQANVVFWVGPGLETTLEKPLRILATQAKVVALIHVPGMALLRARQSGLWDGHDHGEHSDEHINPHIWLDPANAKIMVTAIGAALKDADPANAARYDTNVNAMTARLDALDNDLRKMLAPVTDKRFLVFHDAYPYFEGRYALKSLGAITVSPDRPPGARRVKEIRDKIAGLEAVCVFTEPQFQPALIETLVDGTRAKVATLDPEGTALAPGADLYFVLMRDLGAHVLACLK